jgi:hypothetical protein
MFEKRRKRDQLLPRNVQNEQMHLARALSASISTDTMVPSMKSMYVVLIDIYLFLQQ